MKNHELMDKIWKRIEKSDELPEGHPNKMTPEQIDRQLSNLVALQRMKGRTNRFAAGKHPGPRSKEDKAVERRIESQRDPRAKKFIERFAKRKDEEPEHEARDAAGA